ncbi:MAG: class I SAM-dependent methyltransferase [Phycisphaerae bacterium]|nr:class I SAM-dependent methyltransferase [Phycisphaerae bacterium]MDW8262341.1 class I SAM-dependent methyltransferase [Phycisphaerales bacterium]
MRDDVYEEMFRIEDRHWWYVSKQRIVASLIRRFACGGRWGSAAGTSGGSEVPPGDGIRPRLRIADLGCGCGAMLERLRGEHDVVGVDPSPLAIEFSARRGIAVLQGSFPDQIPLPRESFDVVLLLDVIEHLQDDRAGLATAARLLRTGGVLIATVPAYQWLWSDWDELHHHYRRYNRRRLGAALRSVGLRIELLSYANTMLFPLAAAARVVHKVRRKKMESTDMRIPPAPINALFRGLYSFERHLLGRVPLPFGLSVVAVARRDRASG